MDSDDDMVAGEEEEVEEEEEDAEEEEEDEGSEGVVEVVAPPREAEVDDLLEICVESLVGTVFEMRLSSRETVASIKLRLQRLEGIPKHQMHLLYRGDEMPDAATLAECGVTSGATLRLILALRGGPINTRRVPLPPSQQPSASGSHLPPDLQQVMLRNKDEILDKMPKNGQVTVLLFREGDQINLYHVVERPDGSYTPLSDSWSGSSLKNVFGDGNEQEVDPEEEARLRENALTMTKMSELRSQLKNLSMAKKERRKSRRAAAAANAASASARSGGAGANRSTPRKEADRKGSSAKGRKKGSAGGTSAAEGPHYHHRNGSHASTNSRRPRSHRQRNNRSNNNNNQNPIQSQQQQNQKNPGLSYPSRTEGFHRQQSIGGHGAVALPPISRNNDMADEDLSSTTTSIFPLNASAATNFKGLSTTRRSSLNNSLNNNGNAGGPSNNNLPSLKTSMETVPEWLNKNRTNFSNGGGGSSSKSKKGGAANNKSKKKSTPPRDIDVIDLRLGPDDSDVEVVRTRKTKKLISADIGTINKDMDKPVQVQQLRRSRRRNKQNNGSTVDGRKASSMTSLSTLDASGNASRRQRDGEVLFIDEGMDGTVDVAKASPPAFYSAGNSVKNLSLRGSSGEAGGGLDSSNGPTSLAGSSKSGRRKLSVGDSNLGDGRPTLPSQTPSSKTLVDNLRFNFGEQCQDEGEDEVDAENKELKLRLQDGEGAKKILFGEEDEGGGGEDDTVFGNGGAGRGTQRQEKQGVGGPLSFPAGPTTSSAVAAPRSSTRSRTKPPGSGRRSSGTPKRPSFGTGRPAGSATNRRKKTPKPRCAEQSCRKKLNITNGFPCRCQRVFCARHRHPEIHNCDFDYKAEGRKLLEKANPIVTFPKLPKI